jgi:RNA polymerase sigma-70 factor (ECF subfamily)
VADLVARARDGDRTAFEALYRQHVGRVYALCLRLAADPVRAEELVQDVFVHAWRKLGAFRGESAFSSWLHRIAVNAALQAQRSERRRRARVLGRADLPGAAGRDRGDAPEPPSREPPPGLAIDLERAIGRLPPGARAVFVLHDIEGYRHDEIARVTGLAVGTLKAQLHRARRLLREALNR